MKHSNCVVVSVLQYKLIALLLSLISENEHLFFLSQKVAAIQNVKDEKKCNFQ